MIKRAYLVFLTSLLAVLSSCSVDEAPELDHTLIYEKADEHIELRLRWKANGKADEGMLTDVMLYISRSKDMDNAALDESLGQLTISYPDYYGHERIVPSNRYLFDAYRFYVGVAYHGLASANAPVSFPLTLDYVIDIVNQKTGDTLRSIEKSMVIASNEPNKTRIAYVYSLDVIENEPETEFRNYSFRELEQPITISRESDVQLTNTFSTEKNLYADLIWKVNGEVKAYRNIDLDLFLHDTNNTNVVNFDDLDDYSSSEDSYEGIMIAPDNNYFKDGIPEKLGFYLFDNINASTPATVEFMYTLYSIDGKIKRCRVSGSFVTPPVEANNGTFYFHANITKNGNTYTVIPLSPALTWTP
jgi:hypothetical protein